MRRLAALLSLMMSTMAAALRTVVRLVLRAGRWCLETVAAPRSTAPAAAATADEALDALAEASLYAPAPAATAPKPVPVCPVSEWGEIAMAYAAARVAGEPEPDMRALDEAAVAWLRGLDDADIRRLLMLTAPQAGGHMLGTWPLPGLPRCPTLEQHYAALLSASTSAPAPVVEPAPAPEEPPYTGPRLAYG